MELRYTVKYIQHRGMRQAGQKIERTISKQKFGRLYRGFIIRFAVRTDSDVFSQRFLNHPKMRSRIVGCDKRVYLCFGFQREDFDPVFSVFVTRVEPKLIVSVRRSFFGVQPYRTAFCFPKLVAIGFFDKLGSESVSGAARLAANEFCSGNDVAPLIRSPHLEGTVMVLPKVIEIIPLYQLVRKFGK